VKLHPEYQSCATQEWSQLQDAITNGKLDEVARCGRECMVSLAACGHPAVAVPAFREQVLARLEDEGSVLARWFFSAAPSLTPVDLVQLRAIQSHSTGEEEGLPDTLRVWQSPTTADAWMRSLGERLRRIG
jgi:hypothetical protein